MDKKLTDQISIITSKSNDLLYIVDPTDLSQSSDGSSFKQTKRNFLKEVQAQIDSFPSDSTFLNEVTTTSLEPDLELGSVYCFVGEGTYPNWGGMVVPAGNFAVLSRVDGVFGVSLTTITLDDYAKSDDLKYKANLIVGNQLFDNTDSDILVNKFFGSIGEEVAVANYHATGFMPIEIGDIITTNHNGGDGTFHIFYDENKNFSTATDGHYATVTAPIKGFVRMSLLLSSGETILDANVMINKGSSSMTYEPYKLMVSKDEIDYSGLVTTAEIERKANLVVGNNIFDNTDEDILVNKYMNFDGSFIAVANYHVTGFLPIKAGESITSNNRGYSGTHHGFYDLLKAPINRVSGDLFTITAAVDGYARMSLLLLPGQTILDANIMINNGSSSLDYEPYALKVPLSELPTISAVTYDNTIAAPLKQHFLTTIENNIYLDEFQKRIHPNFILETSIPLGTRKNNILRALLPTAGTYAVENALVDLDYYDVTRKNYDIIVSDLSKTTAIKVLPIGDSYTQIPQYIEKMVGTIPNVTTVGMCKTASGTDMNREGRSGWTLNDYVSHLGNVSSYQPFSPFLHPVSPYKYYGNTMFWESVYNESVPSYVIEHFIPLLTTFNIGSDGFRSTPNVNDVMFHTNFGFKVWNGSAWSDISEATLGFTLNFSKYLSTWNIDTPDVVTILLGMNDFRNLHPSAVSAFFATWKTQMDALITNIKSVNASTKFVICTINSVQYNELSGRANAALWEAYNEIVNEYDDREGEGIYISDTKAAVDRVFSYYTTNETPYLLCSRGLTTQFTGGDIHCAEDGMYLIGEKLAATIQYLRP